MHGRLRVQSPEPNRKPAQKPVATPCHSHPTQPDSCHEVARRHRATRHLAPQFCAIDDNQAKLKESVARPRFTARCSCAQPLTNRAQSAAACAQPFTQCASHAMRSARLNSTSRCNHAAPQVCAELNPATLNWRARCTQADPAASRHAVSSQHSEGSRCNKAMQRPMPPLARSMHQVCASAHAHAVQCACPHLTPQSVAQAGPLAGSRWISISGQCHLHHAARMRTESVSQCSHARVHACLGCARASCQPQRFSRRTGPNHAPRDQVNTDVSMGAWMPPGLSYQPQRCSR